MRSHNSTRHFLNWGQIMTNLSNAEKRAIFTEGAWLLHSRYNSFTPYPETREYVEKEALRRYPDPTEPELKTYKLAGLGECRYKDGKIEVRQMGSDTFHPVLRPTADYLTFARAVSEGTADSSDPKEPTIATVSYGSQFRVLPNGKIQTRGDASQNWREYNAFNVSDLLCLGEIAQEYITNTQEKTS